VWLVDPLAVHDLSPLGRVFAAPGTTTLLHAGDNDLVHLKRRHGMSFTALFDTHVAARFLGDPALGLDVVVRRYLGLELPPSRQRDDWSARPLTEAQRDYAAADVLHLFGLKDRLVDELRRVGRLAWVEEECAALASQAVAERPPDPHAFASVKGARDLSPRGLAALRELHELRERLALAADRPPFKILQEETLARLALALPGDRASLAAVQGCTARVIARWGDALLDALARAQALPESELPVLERRPRPRIAGAVQRRIERLRLWRAEAAPRAGLEPGLVLPNRLIGAIAQAAPRDVAELAAVEGVRRWRAEVFGAEILAALASA
jgi:ribonuclease D